MENIKVKLPVRLVHINSDGRAVVREYLSGNWVNASIPFDNIDEAYAELGRMTIRDTALSAEME
jgi:hypothetical protein